MVPPEGDWHSSQPAGIPVYSSLSQLTMMPANPSSWYDTHAPELARTYESIEAEHVHGWFADLLPAEGGLALDIGAGTGRDAAWLASRGLDVVAVEPSSAMREQAVALHPGARVRWVSDSLPDLRQVLRMGLKFDLILLSAVWMHVPESERARAFRKIVALLKPGGLIAITLRSGPADAERAIYPVSDAEVEQLARAHGAYVERRVAAPDGLGRTEVSWVQLTIRLPDDGTGALPLLRHVILNDTKSSTYKLALLRALGRIADSAAGYASLATDDQVTIPLGLVALYWIRLFKPLLAADLPQSPTNRGMNQLGFVKHGFRGLVDLSPLDLRVGMSFSGDRAVALHAALRDACRTIGIMPATYLTYPGGGPVFPVLSRQTRARTSLNITLDAPYFASFGAMSVPANLWNALRRFNAWIEPALIAEWIRLMHGYAASQGRVLDDRDMVLAMVWSEPARDVRIARELALSTMATASLYCVWSGKRLTDGNVDIDHCFPWSAWPCDHLWNLMPAHRRVNQFEKRDRLPNDETLWRARERILDWWDRGYRRANDAIEQRFRMEIQAGLPTMLADGFDLDDVFSGLALQRLRLKHDQQVPEWSASLT